MPEHSLFLLISIGFFAAGALLSTAVLRRGEVAPAWMRVAPALIGAVFLTYFLEQRGEMHRRCPITNGAEVLTFIGWSVVLIYLLLGQAFRLSLIGLFTLPVIATLLGAAFVWLSFDDPGPRPHDRVDPWLEMHAALSLLAYGGFGLAGIAGVMHMFQNRQLKGGHPSGLFYSLAPIRYLQTALFRLVLIGTILLSAGIAAAFFMQKSPSLTHWIILGAVWVVYAGLLLWQRFWPLPPNRFAGLTIASVAFAFATLAVL